MTPTPVFDEVLTAMHNALSAAPYRFVGEDTGQIDFPADNYPVDFPAALIAVQDVEWENVGDNTQTGECTVSVRLAFDVPEDLNRFNIANVGSGLSRMAWVHQVYQLLENYNPATRNFTRFTRLRQINEQRADRIKVVRMEFSTTVWDTRPPKRGATTTTPRKAVKVNTVHDAPPQPRMIPVVEFASAYEGEATYVLLSEHLINEIAGGSQAFPVWPDVEAGTIVQFVNKSAFPFSTYQGQHTVIEGISPYEFIIATSYESKESGAYFDCELISLPGEPVESQ